MYFVLHSHGLNMAGRWAGLGYDNQIMTGWASMGQTREQSEDANDEPDRNRRSRPHRWPSSVRSSLPPLIRAG